MYFANIDGVSWIIDKRMFAEIPAVDPIKNLAISILKVSPAAKLFENP